MLKNYFITAYRNLWRNKAFSIINILGLALAISFSMLIGMFIWGELQVSNNLKDIDRLYFIEGKWKDDKDAPFFTPTRATSILKENYSHLVEDICRMSELAINTSKDDKHFLEDLLLVDSTFLKMYGFKVLHGNPNTMLTQPHSIVITQKLALKYFGKTNTLNEILRLETQKEGIKPYRISGVLEDMSRNSATELPGARWEMFAPLKFGEVFGRSTADEWWNGHITNIKLKKGILPEEVDKALASIMKIDAPEWIKSKRILKLTTLKRFHLTIWDNYLEKLLMMLSLMVFLILLVAVVNFVNITIGLFSRRLKEIGLRKTFGSNKKQIVLQFMSETLLLTFVSGFTALVLYEIFRSHFQEIFSQELPSITNFQLSIIVAILLFWIFIGVASGIYPSFILSSYPTLEAVHGKFEMKGTAILLGKVLIIFQFSLTIGIIIMTVFITRQNNYFFEKDLGYNKENLLIVMGAPRMYHAEGIHKMEMARNELAKLSVVKEASFSWTHPAWNTWVKEFYKPEQDPKEALVLNQIAVDENYASTFGIQVLAGEFFFNNKSSYKEASLVINTSAARVFGWSPKDAINKKLRVGGNDKIFRVVGVVQDYHFSGFGDPVKPLIFVHHREVPNYRFFAFKLATDDKKSSIKQIESKWRELFKDAPFDFAFMDHHIEKMYETEIQLKKASYIASVLTLVMSFMGIVGMVSLSMAKRTKEVAVRKILGSPVYSIIQLFSKEFLWLIFFATIIACPIAYYFTSKWLNQFAYRVELELWVFAFVCILIILLSLLIIAVQTIRTALSNPVNSLRDE